MASQAYDLHQGEINEVHWLVVSYSLSAAVQCSITPKGEMAHFEL